MSRYAARRAAPAALVLAALVLAAPAALAQSRPDVLTDPGGPALDLVDLVRAENPYAAFAVSLDMLGRPPRASEGETVRLLVRSAQAGYLTIVSRSPSGGVTLLFPNRFSPESRIEAGATVTVPADGTFAFRVRGPFGQEYLKAIVTPAPLVDRAAAERLWSASPLVGAEGAPTTSAGAGLGGRFAPETWAAVSLTITTSPARLPDDDLPTAAPPVAVAPVAVAPVAPQPVRAESVAAARPQRLPGGVEVPDEPESRYGATPDRSWTRAFTSARRALGLGGPPVPQRAGADAPPGGAIPLHDRAIVALYRPTTGTRSFGSALAGGLFNQVRRIEPDTDTRDASGMRSLGRTYGATPEAVLDGLQNDPDVIAAVPNYEFRAFAPTSVRRVSAAEAAAAQAAAGPAERAFWPLQWALFNGFWRSPAQRVDLRWREALALYRPPAQPVVVAVLDTGFYLDNPHLAPALWTNADEVPHNYIDDDGNGYVDDVNGWDTADRDNDPTDTNPAHSHGTFTATQIAGGGPQSVLYSMAPDVRIMPVRVLGGDRGGYDAILEGIRYAAQNGARVINMSLGAGPSASRQPRLERMLEEVFAEVERLGALVVVSSGNEGSDSRTTYTYPARIQAPNALSVAAVGIRGQMTGFSNHGPNVDIAAPGDAVVGHYGPTLGVEEWNGTSMAAPYVAALAAMLFAQHPDWTPAQVRARIVSTARRVPDLDVNTGSIADAGAALAP